MIGKLLGRIKCLFGKHQRKKRIRIGGEAIDGTVTFRCNRCGTIWVSKVKAKAAQTNS